MRSTGCAVQYWGITLSLVNIPREEKYGISSACEEWTDTNINYLTDHVLGLPFSVNYADAKVFKLC